MARIGLDFKILLQQVSENNECLSIMVLSIIKVVPSVKYGYGQCIGTHTVCEPRVYITFMTPRVWTVYQARISSVKEHLFIFALVATTK